MNARWPIVVLTTCLLGALDRPVHAGGGTTHLAQASWALGHIEDQELAALLDEHRDIYLNGALFPDLFNFVAFGPELLEGLPYFYTSDESHSAEFLNAYAKRIREELDGGAPLAEFHMAHFLGVLAHISADYRFDRYFLTRVTRECFTDQYVGQWASYSESQVYTDQGLDVILSPWRDDPSKGIFTPILPDVPWEVVHLSPGPIPPSVLEDAFPGNTTVSWYIPWYVNAGVWGFLQAEGSNPFGFDVDIGCGAGLDSYAATTWETGVGGADDGARVVAQYINTTWEILKKGGLPTFHIYAAWPSVELDIADAYGGPLDEANYVGWLAGPDAVRRVVLGGRNRIGAIARPDGASTDTLWLLDGPVENAWEPTLEIPGRISDVAFEDDRIVAHTGDGQLLERDAAGSWFVLQEYVSDFRLDGDRTAVVQGGVLSLHEPGAPWQALAAHVEAFELAGNRAIVLSRETLASDGDSRQVASSLRLLEAGHQLLWHDLWSSVDDPGAEPTLAVSLDGDRAAVLLDGTLYAREGDLSAPLDTWAVQATGIAEHQLRGSSLGALDLDGNLWLQDGMLGSAWKLIHAGVASFDLEGKNAAWPWAPARLAFQLATGELLTNRTTKVEEWEELPFSLEHVPPIFGALATDYRLGNTVPYDPALGYGASTQLDQQVKPEDRLCAVVDGRLYVKELERNPATSVPPVSLSLYHGLAADWVQMSWTNWATAGPNDYVALYDVDPKLVGPEGYLFGQKQWATEGPSWTTPKQWCAGYYMAYVREDADGTLKILHTAGPIQIPVPDAPTTSMNLSTFGAKMELTWKVKDPGAWDFVALYDHNPWLDDEAPGDPDGYLFAQWQWAVKGTVDGEGFTVGSHTTGTKGAAGYYAAYVQEDALGVHKILAVSEPSQPAAASVAAVKKSGLFADYVQITWNTAFAAGGDWVAVFDHYPTSSGDYLSGEWKYVNGKEDGKWTSGVPWGPGYYVAYIHLKADGTYMFTAISDPTQ